jgi:hypothetical protein
LALLDLSTRAGLSSRAMAGRIECLLGVLGISVCVACGGSGKDAESPTDEYGVPVGEEEEDDYDEVDQPSIPSDGSASKGADEEEEETKKPPPEPEFTEGMSVNEAMNAVPPGIERLNIDQEVLGRPLADPKTYEPCKLRAQDHFKLKVAIWDGRAVGIDIEAKNKKLAECIRQQISQLKWRDKAKSLNTVEYEF